VSSRDGSLISYEASGSGPLIVLVAGALADRTDARKLAAQLSTSFTVVNYDRRGRGASTAARPYYEGCEVHDIESLLAAMGGRGFLFGSSSGGVLALDAAAALANVDGVVVYEPPFIVSDGRAPDPSRFVPAITDAVGAGRLDDAARLFFTKSMGIPALGVLLMRHLMPSWKKMAAMAPTLLHDFAILNGDPGPPAAAHNEMGLLDGAAPRAGRRQERGVLPRGRQGAHRAAARSALLEPRRTQPLGRHDSAHGHRR
jgi:hypothetical protein